MERVHVLLDGKGMTLSHAYVEVKLEEPAGAVLRGEALSLQAPLEKKREEQRAWSRKASSGCHYN